LITPPWESPSVNIKSPIKKRIVLQSILWIMFLLSLLIKRRMEEVTNEPKTISIRSALKARKSSTVIMSNINDWYASLLSLISTGSISSIMTFFNLSLNKKTITR
jgi:hypothetical protein